MSELEREKINKTAIRPYMTRAKAITVLEDCLKLSGKTFDPDFYDAVQFAIGDMHMVSQAHHASSDPRD
jgi:HD-GYP domain-containing protein (c-di-GMP phosphodiesterase class II)